MALLEIILTALFLNDIEVSLLNDPTRQKEFGEVIVEPFVEEKTAKMNAFERVVSNNNNAEELLASLNAEVSS